MAGTLRNILTLFPTQAFLCADIPRASEMAGVLRNIHSMELG